MAFMLLARQISASRLLMSSWFCLALLGGILSFFIPGAAILFVPGLAVIALSSLLKLSGIEKGANIIAVLAALVFSAIVVPTTALAEIMLFPEYAAPFTLFLVLCLIFILPLVLPKEGIQEKLSWKMPGVGLAIVAVFMVVAIMVPAYSTSAPRGLSIIHAVDAQLGKAGYGTFGTDPLPKTMQEVAPFSSGTLVGFKDKGLVAPAPSFETQGIDVQIERNEIVDEQRLLTIKISAPDSDIITGRFIVEEDEEIQLNSMTLNGNAKVKDDTNRFYCHGRNCRSLTLTFALNSREPEASLLINGFRYGLGAEGQSLLSARPDAALPRSWGDLRLVSTMVDLNF